MKEVINVVSAKIFTRDMPRNMRAIDSSLFEGKVQYDVNEISVYCLRSVSVTYAGDMFSGLRALVEFSLSNDEGLLVRYRMLDLLRLYWRSPVVRVNNLSIAVHNIYSDTYYHWLLEVLPRLFLLKDELKRATLLLPDSHNKTFHRDSLLLFGIDKIDYLKRGRRYKVKSLLTTTTIGRIANYNADVVRDMAFYIKRKVDLTFSLGERLFIMRRDRSKRRILNEADLLTILTAFDFQVVDFEDYDFCRQIAMMHNCRVLAGAHGAGLANMIFMQDKGKVFEIRNEDAGLNYFYYSLASVAKQFYYYQFCIAPQTGETVQNADLNIDLALLRENLMRLVNE